MLCWIEIRAVGEDEAGWGHRSGLFLLPGVSHLEPVLTFPLMQGWGLALPLGVSLALERWAVPAWLEPLPGRPPCHRAPANHAGAA